MTNKQANKNLLGDGAKTFQVELTVVWIQQIQVKCQTIHRQHFIFTLQFEKLLWVFLIISGSKEKFSGVKWVKILKSCIPPTSSTIQFHNVFGFRIIHFSVFWQNCYFETLRESSVYLSWWCSLLIKCSA